MSVLVPNWHDLIIRLPDVNDAAVMAVFRPRLGQGNATDSRNYRPEKLPAHHQVSERDWARGSRFDRQPIAGLRQKRIDGNALIVNPQGTPIIFTDETDAVPRFRIVGLNWLAIMQARPENCLRKRMTGNPDLGQIGTM
jgi:hypothetical protein